MIVVSRLLDAVGKCVDAEGNSKFAYKLVQHRLRRDVLLASLLASLRRSSVPVEVKTPIRILSKICHCE